LLQLVFKFFPDLENPDLCFGEMLSLAIHAHCVTMYGLHKLCSLQNGAGFSKSVQGLHSKELVLLSFNKMLCPMSKI